MVALGGARRARRTGSFYEEHLVQRKAASERKSRVPPVGGIGHKMVSKIRIGSEADPAMDSGTAVRSTDKQWGQIKLSPSMADLGCVSPSFADHDPDSELEPLRPREMALDWQPGVIPVDPAVVEAGDSSVSGTGGDDVVESDEMMHSPLQTMQDSALPEPTATLVSGGELDDWWQSATRMHKCVLQCKLLPSARPTCGLYLLCSMGCEHVLWDLPRALWASETIPGWSWCSAARESFTGARRA